MTRGTLTIAAVAAILAFAACSSPAATPTPVPPTPAASAAAPASVPVDPSAAASPAGTAAPASDPAASGGPAASPTTTDSAAPTASPAADSAAPSEPASSSAATAAPDATLAGALGLENREWVLVSISDGSILNPVPGDLRATLTLVDGTASGESGCNTFGVPYTLDLQEIVFGLVVTTLKVCDDDAMLLESNIIQALGGVARYGALETGMAFFSPPGAPLLLYVPAPTGTLTGDWTLGQYQDAEGDIVAPIEGTPVTISFAEDGTISGNDGCNDFTATYQVTGPRIVVESLAGERGACPSDELSTQEEQFLTALQGSVLWTATPEALTFRGENGLLQLSFERDAAG